MQKSTTSSKSNICKLNAIRYEKYCGEELINGVNALSRVIPRVKHLISPIIKAAHDHQETHKTGNIKRTGIL